MVFVNLGINRFDTAPHRFTIRRRRHVVKTFGRKNIDESKPIKYENLYKSVINRENQSTF